MRGEVNRAVAVSLERMAIRQNAVLASVYAFHPVPPEELPEELKGAREAVGKARAEGQRSVRRMGAFFGVGMGVTCGVMFAVLSGSIAFGIGFGALVLVGGGVLFGLGMRKFARYAVVPVSKDELDGWLKAAVAVGYEPAGSSDGVETLKPGFQVGKASGRMFVCRPEGDLAFLAAPCYGLSKVVERAR